MAGTIQLGERRDERAHCPYCKDELAPWAFAWTCPGCETRHHEGCAKENGRCTVLGCGAAHPSPGRSSSPARPTVRPSRVEVLLDRADHILRRSTWVVALLATAAFMLALLVASSGLTSRDIDTALTVAGVVGALIAPALFALLLPVVLLKAVIRSLRSNGEALAKIALVTLVSAAGLGAGLAAGMLRETSRASSTALASVLLALLVVLLARLRARRLAT